jgi:MFS transporter, FSR family, fosmidomycin resistance protein
MNEASWMNTIEESANPRTVEPVEISSEKQGEDLFHLPEVVTVAAAHGANDTYFSFLPTILPLLIKNLALNTTQAGLLTVFGQIPNLLQPVIGHLADRRDLKMLIILAPTISGILITLVGVAPSFGLASLLLLLAGFSSAGFHAIAPSMVSARAGKKVGRGMGFFMVGGELGFGIGPLLVVAVIGYLTLRGLPWLMILGMLASIILYFRLKNASTIRHAQAEASLPVRQALGEMSGMMLPMMGITFITGFLTANLVNFLPTFLSSEGVAFSLAGASLSVVELSGTVGALLMGLFSDRLGQRNIVIWSILLSATFSLGFLLLQGWIQIVMLIGVGMSAFVANPAFLSMLQTRFARNRSLANGIYMSGSFILRSIVVVLVGSLADRFGMRPVFFGSALAALLALPLIFMLPQR